MRKLTVMIRADFQSLVPSHDQSGLLILLVLQQPHVSCSALFPLPRVTVESEKFRTHLEGLFLRLFIGLGVDLLGQMDNRFEVDFWRINLLFL